MRALAVAMGGGGGSAVVRGGGRSGEAARRSLRCWRVKRRWDGRAVSLYRAAKASTRVATAARSGESLGVSTLRWTRAQGRAIRVSQEARVGSWTRGGFGYRACNR